MSISKMKFVWLLIPIFAWAFMVWNGWPNSLYHNGLSQFALADDDEDEEEEEEDDDREESSSSEPKTVTTYVKLPDQVVKRTITTIIYDSDGDGVFDPDDKNPTVHDAYIVQDQDQNGIDDAYEQH